MALTEQQLKDRKNYIGGSDISAIFGYNKWKTALDIYNEKTSDEIKQNGNTIDNNYIDWGNEDEPILLSKFEREICLKVKQNVPIRYHDKYDFLAANVDGIAFDLDEIYILEAKSICRTHDEWGDPVNDINYNLISNNQLKQKRGQIPAQYLFQVAYYCAIYNSTKAYILVRFGNHLPMCVYQYNRDHDFENHIIENAKNFWVNHIQKKIPPKPQTYDDVKELYKNAIKQKEIIINNDIIDKYIEMTELQKQYNDLERKIKKYKKELLLNIEDAEIINNLAHQTIFTCPTITSERIDNNKLKEKYPDVARDCSYTIKYRRFYNKLK
ncbi:MAG: YqaJ viral recombinase family protein [Candidatus Pacearchaeota archaeon]|jgi:putative phage-type endonuclease